MKWVGCLCILLAGYLTGHSLLRPAREHLKLLQEGNTLFALMESGIRFSRVPLPDLFAQLAEHTETAWKAFFGKMQEDLHQGTESELSLLYGQELAEMMGPFLSGEEMDLFLGLGNGMLTGDLLYARKNMEQIQGVLGRMIEEEKALLKDRTRLVVICCMSAAMLVVIVLL